MQSTAELLPGPLLWLPLGPLQSRCAVRSNTCPLSHSPAPRSPSRALACAMHVHILTTTRAPHARAQTTGGGHRTLHPPLPPRPAALIFGPPRAAAALLPVQPTGGGTRQSGCLGWWHREGGGAGGRDGGGGGRGLGSFDEKTCHDPRNDIPSASGSMVADVLTLLTVIIIGSAVLLAQGRLDG